MAREKNSFRKKINETRTLIDSGKYNEAFNHIVNEKAGSAKQLFQKIACLIDIGFILREEKILKYSIYLMEQHGKELADVPELAPYVLINLANQYANMAALYSFNDDFHQFFRNAELSKAVTLYRECLRNPHVPEDLKPDIYQSYAASLMNAGRSWEALEAYQIAVNLTDGALEPLLHKSALMIDFCKLNDDNASVVRREAWHILDRCSELDEQHIWQEDIEHQRKRLLQLETEKFLSRKESYPRLSVRTEKDFEQFYIETCVKNRLYINTCSFCGQCDHVIGDKAYLNGKNIPLSGKGDRHFYHLAMLLNQLKQEYAAARYLLVYSLYRKNNLKFAELNFQMIKLEDFSPKKIKAILLERAYLQGWDLFRIVGEFLNQFLHLQLSDPSPFTLWKVNGSIRSGLKERNSPSLHALFELLTEIDTGSRSYLKKTAQILFHGHKAYLPVEADQNLSDKSLEDQAFELYKILKNILIYMMFLIEEECSPGQQYRQFFSLQPLILPDHFKV